MTHDALPRSRSGKGAKEVAVALVQEAGTLLLEHFRDEKQIQVKGRGNIVTDIDLLAERHVLERLRSEFPTFSLLSEESQGYQGTADYTWVLDPLDGTRNYASGIPHCAVSMALARGDEVVLGLTFDPFRSELFWAQKDQGAFVNDMPLQVSDKSQVRWCVVGFDMGYQDDRARNALHMITALWPGMQSIRIMGSAALGLAYAAAGRLDLYFHHNLAPWDIAAGLLLVQEAGGTITDRHGSPVTYLSDSAIASNAAIHADFLKLTEGMEWRR